VSVEPIQAMPTRERERREKEGTGAVLNIVCHGGRSWEGKKADVGHQVFFGFDRKVFCEVFNIDPLVMAVPAVEGDDVVSISVVGPVEKNRRLAFFAVPADINHY
jgi:hypothetical protein